MSSKQSDKLAKEQYLEAQVNQVLDESVENLSPDIRRRLNQARIKAVEQKQSRLPLWKLASGVSFAIALILFTQLGYSPQPEPLEPFAEELAEDPEMLDDLEFIYWMAEEETIASL